jgi:hypothetical protein
MEVFLPALLLALVLLIGKRPQRLAQPLALSRFDHTFLVLMGLGPFLCTALLSFLLGFKLRAGWGEPLFSLCGLLLMAYLRPRITRARFYSFLGLFAALFTLALVGYALAFTQSKETSSANFPGAELAKTLTADWQQSFHQPLSYVAGSRWLSGNLAFYSADHPRVYINWNQKLSPWIQETELRQKGGIFIWEKNEIIPEDLAKRFPHLGHTKVMHMNWLRNKNLPPIEINVAYLPPETAFRKPVRLGGTATKRNQSRFQW